MTKAYPVCYENYSDVRKVDHSGCLVRRPSSAAKSIQMQLHPIPSENKEFSMERCRKCSRGSRNKRRVLHRKRNSTSALARLGRRRRRRPASARVPLPRTAASKGTHQSEAGGAARGSAPRGLPKGGAAAQQAPTNAHICTYV
eukprot:scaffold4455_cov403-Prasinococcus_capsulatus_cf.AAC.2